VALCALAPAGAVAEEIPPYEGMSFPSIQAPTGPEEFSWEVKLGEDQELRTIDDRHAAVYYTDGVHVAFGIEAAAAHDAVGKSVPTTLAVTQPNIITLTVHHRAGNPAAGGASFTYPVSMGESYETGYATVIVQMPPPTEGLAPPPLSAIMAPCLVPNLRGRSLKASRKILGRNGCNLGPVRGERGKGAKVVKQYRKPGSALPAETAVGVKLG
jgi:hypothetical protein